MTKAIEPGKVNEVIVAIKDPYYAIANTGDAKNPSVRHMFNVPADWIYDSSGLGVARYADLPVLLQVRGAGMFETPSFVVAGPAYTSDVFAMPSVKKKELGLEITVANPTAAPLTVKIANEVAPLAGGAAEKTFAGEGADRRPRQGRNRQRCRRSGRIRSCGGRTTRSSTSSRRG